MDRIAQLVDIITEWRTICDKADEINAALPEAARARIEARPPGDSPLATMMAAMPMADRLGIRVALDGMSDCLVEHADQMMLSAPGQSRRVAGVVDDGHAVAPFRRRRRACRRRTFSALLTGSRCDGRTHACRSHRWSRVIPSGIGPTRSS